MNTQELVINVYPKNKRFVCTTTTNRRRNNFGRFGGLGTLDTAVRHIYEQTLFITVELPKMEEYPLFELSNPKANFEEAESKYPELSLHFQLLQKMKEIYFKKGGNCRRFLNSMCTSHKAGKSYLDIIVIYPNYAIDEVTDFFNSIGVNPSSIIN